MGGDRSGWVGWGAQRGGCYWKAAAKVDRNHSLKGKHKSSVTDKMFGEGGRRGWGLIHCQEAWETPQPEFITFNSVMKAK